MNQRFRHRLLTGALGVLALASLAFHPGTTAPLPDFDKREPAAAVPSADTAGLNVSRDPITGAPKFVTAPKGFLTGSDGGGNNASAKSRAASTATDPHHALKTFLDEHTALYGHGAEVLAAAVVTRDFTTAHSGLRTTVWQQQVDGIPVFESVLVAHVTKNGELVNVASQFITDPAAAAGTAARARAQTTPPITAPEALRIAAKNLGTNLTAISLATAATGAEQKQNFTAPELRGPATARLVWLPLSATQLTLCWDLTLTSRARTETFQVLVDAQTGNPLLRHCLTEHLSDATYNVFTSDSPSPFSPGWPTPDSSQPLASTNNRTLVTLPALNTNASPEGWIPDGGNETLGNNVDAHTDRDGNNVADLPRPQGSPFRVFDFPLDLDSDPTNSSAAAVVQLFYWCNFMHDKLYELGFTEAAGNFQSDNFGRGGFGGDAVQADAQDGSDFNNANMTTPGDGSPPRLQMYLFNGPSPYRDGDLDAEIVLHEYTHGLSNRRVGGGAGISALQTRGMGEGWSDFYALALLSEPGDDPNAAYAFGGYATYQLGGLTQNYYYGIRRYPYSTDLAKNPLTFKDIDPTQASAHAGVSISPIADFIHPASEVHKQGEVWCVTLWEARALLVTKYGDTNGNQLMLQLVTDGLNLAPANPTFLQARDAILQADEVNNGGANLPELWIAFAKRGMGFSATSPASSTTTGVFEAFDLPDDLRIMPATAFTATGPVGGPFDFTSWNLTLTNLGVAALDWTVGSNTNWLAVSTNGGNLATNVTATVTASLTGVATNLAAGVYTGALHFTNITGSNILQNVLGENHTLTDGNTVMLNQSNVLAPSVQVWDITHTVLYINGPDYLLINHDPLTEIQRSPGGLIPNGSTVAVDYSFSEYAPNFYGRSQTRRFTLSVGQPDDFFAELFSGDTFDLDHSSITFTPDGSVNDYSACRSPADRFPTDPAGGRALGLSDDSFAAVTLSGTNTVALYQRRTNTFFVGSNGYLTFSSGDSDNSVSFASHFSRPRIAALLQDWNPEAGGSITAKELADRVAVTYAGVPKYNSPAPNNFQVELFFDGRIRLTWLGINCRNGISGLSEGLGVPAGFAASDLDTNSYCPATPPVITMQPADTTAFTGETIRLEAALDGSLPITCQWQFNGTNLPAATNTAITLAGVTADQAGTYALAVTNAAGDTVSSNATLTVLPAISLAAAVNATNLTFTTGGTAAWLPEMAVTHDGLDAAQSGEVGDLSESWLQTVITHGPGTLTFWWRVSSENGWDYLEFHTNGVTQATLTGESGWQPHTLCLPAGNQTLQWRYIKDTSLNGGLDRGWLDEVKFVPDVPLHFLPLQSPDGHLHLRLESAGEVPLEAAQAGRVQFVYSTNLALDFNSWLPVTNAPVFTNGGLELDGLSTTNTEQQFFRARQNP